MSHLKNEMIIKGLVEEIYNTKWSDVRTFTVKEKTVEAGDITGNLSESGKVVVSLGMNSGEKLVYDWFIKILPKDHKNSELMHKFNIFENEINFYKEIAPDLLKFLRDNGVMDVEFDIPKLLFADNKEEGAVIILEDISVQGYGQGRDENGGRFLSEEKAKLAIDAIARIHAVSKLYNAHNTTKLGEKHIALRHNDMWEDDGFLDRLSAMKDSYCEVLKKSSEHDSARLLERFQQAFDSSMQLKNICAERYAPKKPGTVYLQHGDFHFNNLLFKEEVGQPLKVIIVDWQLTYVGRSTGDISYLLLSSIDPTMKHIHESLKEAYFTSFNGYIKSYEASIMDKLSDNVCGISFSIECDDNDDASSVCSSAMTRSRTLSTCTTEDLDHDYQDSNPLSFFLSCGNVLNTDSSNTPDLSDDERDEVEQATVSYAYNLVKEAAEMDII